MIFKKITVCKESNGTPIIWKDGLYLIVLDKSHGRITYYWLVLQGGKNMIDLTNMAIGSIDGHYLVAKATARFEVIQEVITFLDTLLDDLGIGRLS